MVEKTPPTTVIMNHPSWDITSARFATLNILAQITLPIPIGEILKNIKFADEYSIKNKERMSYQLLCEMHSIRMGQKVYGY